MPVCAVTVLPCTTSPIILSRCASAARLYVTSPLATVLPRGCILVLLNSSPTIAVNSGTGIGNVSKNVPVLTKILVLTLIGSSKSTSVPAATTSAIFCVKLVTVVTVPDSAGRPLVICKTSGVYELVC